MMRGTFGNIRLRNQLAPGTEGGWTVHQPSGEQMTIYDAAQRYKEEQGASDSHRGLRVWQRLIARLGGQRHVAAGVKSRSDNELRAHSSF